MSKQQRQLAAIVFTDISNFTSLMDKNESNALSIRHKQRDNIQIRLKEFNGEYIKEIGDGDLIMFNSATDAVNFTLKLQSDIKPDDNYMIRAAIHIGDVIRENNDIFGAGVNMASRIHAFASPGQTVISDSIFNLYSGTYSLQITDSLGCTEDKEESHGLCGTIYRGTREVSIGGAGLAR